jgi:hypothetical protein
MQIKNLQVTIEYLSRHMLNVNDSSATTASTSPSATHTSVEVNPIVIKKTPKFPSRDRHLAIRRKKSKATNSSPTESERSEIFSFEQSSNSRRSSSSSNNSECEKTSEIHE